MLSIMLDTLVEVLNDLISNDTRVKIYKGLTPTTPNLLLSFEPKIISSCNKI